MARRDGARGEERPRVLCSVAEVAADQGGSGGRRPLGRKQEAPREMDSSTKTICDDAKVVFVQGQKFISENVAHVRNRDNDSFLESTHFLVRRQFCTIIKKMDWIQKIAIESGNLFP